jgi:predicted enzyme related to lactoylglutathione lyase
MKQENIVKDMIILYVADQQCSCDFYKSVLGKEPILDVPGMTEFELNEKTLLGLMPESGIEKILGDKTPRPSTGNGIPRCELYIAVPDVVKAFKNLISNGGKSISPPEMRNWGHLAAYGADPDGNIIAFAENTDTGK